MAISVGRGAKLKQKIRRSFRLLASLLGCIILMLIVLGYVEVTVKFKGPTRLWEKKIIGVEKKIQTKVRHVVLTLNESSTSYDQAGANRGFSETEQPGISSNTGTEIENLSGKGGNEGFTVFKGAPWKRAVGSWFELCGSTSEPISIVENLYSRSCPGDCLQSGVCNQEFSECRCRSGYNGTDCGGFDDHPCNLDPFIPGKLSRWVVSICPAACDNRTAQCFCGPDSLHPDRPLIEPCGMSTNNGTGMTFTERDREFLYGTQADKMGWCNADATKVAAGEQKVVGTCWCSIDGREGPFCDEYSRSYCVGGCNNHGTCFIGYCQCDDGWYGIDCSVPSAKSKTPYEYTPPWLRLDEGGGEAQEPSWKLAEAEGKKQRRVKRRRPLIYIYDLPGEFTFHHYEGRQIRHYCVPWMYNANNETMHNWNQLYGMESMVIEGLLASPHRTTNHSEADYFFVPIPTACFLSRADETPRLGIKDDHFLWLRPYITMDLVIKAHAYIQENYPFWNRSEGRDHIWMFPWDEGGCYAPQVIWNSIVLSSWGNTMANHNTSTTAYGWDNWDPIPKTVRGTHPCFDPAKDIVMPAWKVPNEELLGRRLWSRTYEDRQRLFYFNGNLGPAYHNGRPEENYSMRIRQNVAKYFGSTPNKESKLGELFEEGVVVTHAPTSKYSDELSSSKFCGVFPGDGFSARMEDSILHGCIPVIIQDGIEMAFENVMELSEFSVRIAEDEIPEMINILKALSEAEVRSKLAAIQGLWQRWSYSSVLKVEAARQLEWHGHRPLWGVQYGELTEDDAMATLIQVLHYKLYNDPWRRGHTGTKLKHGKNLGLPPECPSANS